MSAASPEFGETPAVRSADRPPGRWAWPVIILAPFLMLAAESLIPAAETEADAQSDLSLLAMLQVQVKLIIAMDGLDGASAQAELQKLVPMANGDETVAALAVTRGFLEEEEGKQEDVIQWLERRSGSPGADEAFLTRVRSAILEGVDEGTRSELRGRLGWFADLLGTIESPGEPPAEERIRSEAAAHLLLAGFGLSLGLLAILVGAGVLLVALIYWGSGKLRFAFDAQQGPAGIFLESFAIFLGSMALGNLSGWMIHWSMHPIVSLAGVVIALLWPRFRGVSWRSARLSLGLHVGKGWLREVGAGIVGYLVLLPTAVIGLTGSLLLMMIARALSGGVDSGEGGGVMPSEPVTHPAVGWLLGGWEAKLLVFLLAAVLAPLLEEIFFRGAFFRSLRTRLGMIGAGLLSGFIFAALHPQGWMAIPALTAMGFAFASIREWRDSLIAPMVAHAINNGLLIGGLALILS